MKQSICIIMLLVLGLLSSKCGNNEDDCFCPPNETCIFVASTGLNKCYLTESIHYLGGTRVIVPNSYVGITNNSQCIDTLIFYNDTTRALDDERFGLIVDVHPTVQDVLGSIPPVQIDDNEYIASTIAPLCFLSSEGWYANLNFKLYPDSVSMRLRYWTLESPPGVFIDSSFVTFYKKH